MRHATVTLVRGLLITAAVLSMASTGAPASAGHGGGAQSSGTALQSELYGVSCSSASACTAVGDAVTSAGVSVTVAERWNGTAWAIQSTPTPGGAAASYLSGVSCASASACTAVGQYVTSVGATVPLVERWNGTAWAVQPAANPSGATASFLDGVSCSSASACTAVGYSRTSAGVTVPLAQRWDGTAWAIQATPAPSGATASYLLGVSCTSASACTATGLYLTSAGATGALAERWDGTAWTIQATPAPSGATASQLYAVACASASACTAVGNYVTSTGATVPLAERWNGTAWAIQSTPTPSDAIASYLNGVSCTSAAACTAVGWYEVSPGDYETLAERWDGTAWAIQSTPNPSGATASYLFGVSCTSSPTCSAVGYDLNPSYTVLAEGWNGTAWAVQSTPTP